MEQVFFLHCLRNFPETIDPSQTVVSIAIETTRYVIDLYTAVKINLINRFVVVNATGVLVD